VIEAIIKPIENMGIVKQIICSYHSLRESSIGALFKFINVSQQKPAVPACTLCFMLIKTTLKTLFLFLKCLFIAVSQVPGTVLIFLDPGTVVIQLV
jgi:hypothetical protein